MSISSDQYMQAMETGMVDVRQCVVKMELSLQKLVSDSKSMQQLVKQSLSKPSGGASSGSSGAAAGASGGAKIVSNVLSDAAQTLGKGLSEKVLKFFGVDTGKKEKDGEGTAQENGQKQGTPDFNAMMSSQIGQYLQWNEAILKEMFNSGNKTPFNKDRDSLTDLFRSENMDNALQQTAENGKQASDEISKAMQGGMKQTETALTNFVKTGKMSFADLTRSILADIAQIMLKLAVSKLISFVFGAESSAAGGYDIPSGENPVTQLHEKEMVLPAQYADVIRGLANTGGASGGGVNINTSISVAEDGSTRQQSDGGGESQRQLANMINDQTKAIIAREMRQGGLIWNMRMGVA